MLRITVGEVSIRSPEKINGVDNHENGVRTWNMLLGAPRLRVRIGRRCLIL
jgi:hypothetical protein